MLQATPEVAQSTFDLSCSTVLTLYIVLMQDPVVTGGKLNSPLQSTGSDNQAVIPLDPQLPSQILVPFQYPANRSQAVQGLIHNNATSLQQNGINSLSITQFPCSASPFGECAPGRF